MEFIVEEEEIDIKYEYDINDHDLGNSYHCPDWKLYPNVECRVMLERWKSLDSEGVVQRNLDEIYEAETEMRSGQNESVDKSCGVYQKLKLLVDILKNSEKIEECGDCDKYFEQLQQHLLLTHGNNRDVHENNPTETTMTACEPVNLDRNDVSSEKKTMDVKISHGGVDKNSGGGLVPSLTENEGEPISRKDDPTNINKKSFRKGGKSKPYKCYKCQVGFLTFYELTQHHSTHTEERQVTQNTRGNTVMTRASSNQQGLTTRFRNQQFKCDICRKGFHNSFNLIRHEKVHTREKPYKCNVCGNCFTQNSNLKTHKLTHTGEKPHSCDMCVKCFGTRSKLTTHKLVHTGEKPYKCDVCGNRFAQSGGLAQHKLVHTGAKPHKCEQCGRRFTHNSNLTKHTRTHTGEKPYKCDVCEKCFRDSSNLTPHMRTHTGEKPHKCELCGKCFKFPAGLCRHKLVHTR